MFKQIARLASSLAKNDPGLESDEILANFDELPDGPIPEMRVRVVNVTDLQPTMLFDGLREGDRLARCRRAMGRSLHASLAEIAESEPQRWQRILDVHLPTMKSL